MNRLIVLGIFGVVLITGCVYQEQEWIIGNYISGCTYIDEPGEYFVTQNIIDKNRVYCINITASNVLLDCRNYTIEGLAIDERQAVNIQGSPDGFLTNITVKNCYVQEWGKGISFQWIENSRICNVHTNKTSSKNGIGFAGGNSRNVVMEHVSVNWSGDGSFMRGYGIGFNNVNNSVIRDFVVNWTSDIGVIPNGWHNIVEFGDMFYCSRALACSYPASQNNTFRNIRVHIMMHSSGGIGRSVIDLGEATGNIIPHKFYNNWFNKSGPEGQVDYIEDSGFRGEKPEAWFSINITSGENTAGGPFIAGNYWAGPNGNGFSDTCKDSDDDRICDSGYVMACQGSCDSEYWDRFPLA